MKRKVSFILVNFILSLVLISVLVLANTADNEATKSGLSLDKTRVIYLKGETVTFSGSCTPEELFTIKATNEGRKVFEREINCDFDGKYKTSYTTAYLDPSGRWSVGLYNGETRVLRRVYTINQTRESGFYVITFFSPSASVHYRTEKIKLSVQVTDSGTAVEDANVVSWDAEWNKIALSHKGNGIYFAEYEIPYNITTGEFEVTVVAANFNTALAVGGERSIKINVEQSPIKIRVIEPQAHTFDSGSGIPMKVEATYIYDKPLENGEVVVSIDGTGYLMNKISDTMYSFQYLLSEEEKGSVNVMFSAADDAENRGQEKVGIVVRSSLSGIILANILYIIVAIAVVVVAILVIFPKTRHMLLKKALERKRQKLIRSIEKLQKDYFERHSISKEIYREKRSKMEAELSEVEKKLK